MLTRFCKWVYGLTPIFYWKNKDLELICEGSILSRPAMRELPQVVRRTVGMMHFGGVVKIDKKMWQETNPLIRLAGVHVIHYFRNPATHILEVMETNCLDFLFGCSSVQNIPIRQLQHPDPFFVLTDPSLSKRMGIVQMMISTKGSSDYSLFRRNCEHWMRSVVIPPQDQQNRIGWSHIQSLQILVCCAVFFSLFSIGFALWVFKWRKRHKNCLEKKNNETEVQCAF